MVAFGIVDSHENPLQILAEKSKDETDRELLRQSESQLNVIRSKSELDKKLSSKSYFKNKEWFVVGCR